MVSNKEGQTSCDSDKGHDQHASLWHLPALGRRGDPSNCAKHKPPRIHLLARWMGERQAGGGLQGLVPAPSQRARSVLWPIILIPQSTLQRKLEKWILLCTLSTYVHTSTLTMFSNLGSLESQPPETWREVVWAHLAPLHQPPPNAFTPSVT